MISPDNCIRNGDDLHYFFEPSSVAVIGSLRMDSGLAFRAISNMLHFGYKGKIYPVNPGYEEVLGLSAYQSVEAVAEPIDQAIVITPPKTVPGIIDQCGNKGVKAVVIVSENFAEIGADGIVLQQHVTEIARSKGIRIVGPNTIGLINSANGFITAPYFIAYDRLPKGNVSYCSQTGFVGPTAQPLFDRGYPINKTCDVGNKCDVNEVDLLNYLANDSTTSAVALHLEDIKDGRAFISAARKLVAKKPLIVMKAGRTLAGGRASASHTGSLAGNDIICDAAFRQAGAIRVNTWQEFWDVPRVFGTQQLPKGNRVGIVTHTGGAGVVATDAAVEAGLVVTNFTDSTLKKLSAFAPRLATNPVDLGPVLSTTDNPFMVQEESVAIAMEDDNVDCVAAATYGGIEGIMEPIVQMFTRLKQRCNKPMAVWIYGMKLSAIEETVRELQKQNIPAYIEFETAVKALSVAAHYAQMRKEM